MLGLKQKIEACGKSYEISDVAQMSCQAQADQRSDSLGGSHVPVRLTPTPTRAGDGYQTGHGNPPRATIWVSPSSSEFVVCGWRCCC